MVTVKPKWLQRSSFPYRLYAYVLMFVQGMFGGNFGGFLGGADSTCRYYQAVLNIQRELLGILSIEYFISC